MLPSRLYARAGVNAAKLKVSYNVAQCSVIAVTVQSVVMLSLYFSSCADKDWIMYKGHSHM